MPLNHQISLPFPKPGAFSLGRESLKVHPQQQGSDIKCATKVVQGWLCFLRFVNHGFPIHSSLRAGFVWMIFIRQKRQQKNKSWQETTCSERSFFDAFHGRGAKLCCHLCSREAFGSLQMSTVSSEKLRDSPLRLLQSREKSYTKFSVQKRQLCT